jgi:putative phosphoesterase
MRIGLISDVHANLQGLRAVLGELKQVDSILFAGDLTGYYTRPNEVISELMERNVQMICGNHDRYLQQPPEKPNDLLRQSIAFTRTVISKDSIDLLGALPCHRQIVLDGIRITLFHGSPWDPLEQYIYPDYGDWEQFDEVDGDLIVLGHTHRPMERRIGNKIIVNPGSCGQPRDRDRRAAYAIFDSESREVEFHRVTYDIDAVIREIRMARLDDRLASMLCRA